MAKISVSNTSNSNPKTNYVKIDRDLIKDMAPIETIENPLHGVGGDKKLRYNVYIINSYDSPMYYLIDDITLDIIHTSSDEQKFYKNATAKILQYTQKVIKENFLGKRVAYYTTTYHDWKIGTVAGVFLKRRTRAHYGYSYYEPYFKIVDERGKQIRNFIRDCKFISEKDINQIKKLSAEYITLSKKASKTGDKLRDLLRKSKIEFKVTNT